MVEPVGGWWGVTGGLQPSRQKVKGMRIKMAQQNNYRRLLKNESLDEITCCSLQLRKSKTDQAVEGIYIILSNIWKGTAFLRQGVSNCGFQKPARYNLNCWFSESRHSE